MASDAAGAFLLREDLVAAVSAARPTCYWFEQGKCKKGHKCTLLHKPRWEGDPDANEVHLPHVSCTRTPQGKCRVTVRPPLPQMWLKFFGVKTLQDSPLQGGQQVDEMIIYPLQNMLPRDEAACAKTKGSGSATIPLKSGGNAYPGKATKIEMPRWLLHSTDIEAALNILKERGLRATTGIAGDGMYGFRMEDDSIEELPRVFTTHASRSGYNKGAGFVLEVSGMLVNEQQHMILPPGAGRNSGYTFLFYIWIGDSRAWLRPCLILG